jgi:S-adenosyl methyltransferase
VAGLAGAGLGYAETSVRYGEGGTGNAMTMQPGWVPPGVDTGNANIARVYDWWLGGDHNFRADQDAARAMIAVEPNARGLARANRAFLGRAVRFLAAEAGIRQFLDIGSGIPTQNNVHQVAQDAAPGTRVVYADVDDVVVAHSRLILDGNADAAVIQADVRDPASILADPATQMLLDFTRPIAVLLVAVLHFIADADNPEQIVATLRDALPPGSYLVVSHGCSDSKPELLSAFENVYKSKVAAAQGRARTRVEITRFFDGFTLIDPGLVWLPQWRPDQPSDVPDDPEKYWFLAGVGQLARTLPQVTR